ncbi:MAG: DUF5362 family protein [bacterium]
MDQLDTNQEVLQPADDHQQLVRELSAPLFAVKGWMRLLGVLSIIGGIITVFSLWGIVICWIPIWIGVLLLKAASAIELAQLNGDRDQLTQCLQQFRTYFTLQGVLSLIYIVAGIIGFIVMGGALLGLIAGLGDYSGDW